METFEIGILWHEQVWTLKTVSLENSEVIYSSSCVLMVTLLINHRFSVHMKNATKLVSVDAKRLMRF